MFEKVRVTAQGQSRRNSHCVCDWLPTPHLMNVCVHARGGQRPTCGTQHSPSTMRVLNAGLRPGSQCLYPLSHLLAVLSLPSASFIRPVFN